MKKKIDKFMETTLFKILCIIDTIIGVAAFFFRDIDAVNVIFCIATILMFIVGCYLAFRYKKFLEADKKISQLEEENNELQNSINRKNSTIELLEQNINNGIKYTNNEATVTLDKRRAVYCFEFTKEFEVISDNTPRWYSAQFYANKVLKDKKESKDYYRANTIKWSELKVRATISYLKPGSEKYTDPEKLDVNNITDESNYIPFNIQYVTSKKKRTLNICKGTKVKLKYSYEVPIDLWGSYLNRHVSYFGEPTIVYIKYDIDTELDFKASLLSGNDGTPIDTTDYEITKDEQNGYSIQKITLNPIPFAKYRIWWDSEKYFVNDTTTEDTADSSQLTSH